MSFLFPAEDGIRDGHVTGVQTCALPIFEREFRKIDVDEDEYISQSKRMKLVYEFVESKGMDKIKSKEIERIMEVYGKDRSEERRVGKECRAGWGADEERKEEKE